MGAFWGSGVLLASCISFVLGSRNVTDTMGDGDEKMKEPLEEEEAALLRVVTTVTRWKQTSSGSVPDPAQLRAAPVRSGWGESRSERQQELQTWLDTSSDSLEGRRDPWSREHHTGADTRLWLLQCPLRFGKWRMRGTCGSAAWPRRCRAAAQGAAVALHRCPPSIQCPQGHQRWAGRSLPAPRLEDKADKWDWR